ncbi:MAG: FAD-dependent oxidoreductase, partial [Pseudomonadota bacterium]
QKSLIIVGAGVIGAAVAYHLARAGARVTIVDAGHAGATAASFGWINASFFLTEDHYHLRAEGIAAYHRLGADIDLPINWCGSVCWEEGRLEDRQDALARLGYPVERLSGPEFAKLEPAVGTPPELSLHLPTEGVAEPVALAATLLHGALEAGARVMRGLRVVGVLQEGPRVTGVRTHAGDLRADEVFVAAGVGSRHVMEMVGFDLPMLHRPALVIKTAPVAPLLGHILVSNIGEVRQLPDGSLTLPAAVGHQGDASDEIGDLEAETEAAFARLQALVPDVPLTLAETIVAERPMPGDGLPAVGPVRPGAYLATMHSGITLAAIMGELISEELLNGETNHTRSWLAPYRPDRFTPSGISNT